MGSLKPYHNLKPLRRRMTYSRYTLLTLCSVGLLILAFIALTFASISKYIGPDMGECRNIYMYPSYMRINGFDESHTRFAKKYSLFLYREQGKDPDFTQHQGIPILFIPGNAGSYKQSRSIAAQTTNLFLEKFYGTDSDKINLDFFAADFNEDLTAFHGRTLLDQAEYLNEAIKFILSLYELKPEDTKPKSVILLGHSMGGIVARTIMTLPNYVDNTVNTIITLAAPHSAAPATFDGDLLRIYSDIDNFWRSAFIEDDSSVLHQIASKRLANVSLISITGGVPDNTLPADYTQTEGLMPEDQSFTVFTAGIPDVFTSIDHLAIVWCDQLRKKLAEVLLAITTTSSSDCTYPLQERMSLFRRLLLSGFESMAKQDFEPSKIQTGKEKFDIRLKLDSNQMNSNILRIPANGNTAKVNMFNIKDDSSEKKKFTLLSSLPFVSIKDNSTSSNNPVVVGCRKSITENDDIDTFLIDYTSSRSVKFIELDCIDLIDDAHTIPRSMLNTKSISESSYGGDYNPFHVLQYDPELVSLFDTILVIENPNALDNDGEEFILGELQPTESTQLLLGEQNFWKLLTIGYQLSLPSSRPLAVDISVPSAWSSLVSYKMTINGISSLDITKQKFAPFLRQSMETPLETKWHVAIHDRDTRLINIHGNSPFIQYHEGKTTNLHLQLWTDSQMMNDEVPLDIYLSVDIMNSLKLLVLRYRLAVVSFPVSICFLVVFFQLRIFQKTGEFISVWDGLMKLCDNRFLGISMVFLALLTPLLSIKSFAKLLSFLNPIRFKDTLYHDSFKNSLFLGLREKYLLLLGPMFYIISIALVAMIYQVIMVFGKLLILIDELMNSFGKRNITSQISSLEESFGRKERLNIFKSRKQIFATLTLLGAVSIYIPYQMAYIVSCIVQLVVTIRVFLKVHRTKAKFPIDEEDYNNSIDNGKSLKVEAQLSRSPSGKKGNQSDLRNLFNYQVTIMNLMIWIIPINITLVVVFLHNFALRWTTPFSSHHNLLAILPILLVVEKHVNGKMIARNERSKKLNPFLCSLLVYFALFSLLFGVRNLYCLHHLLNLFFVVLLFSF